MNVHKFVHTPASRASHSCSMKPTLTPIRSLPCERPRQLTYSMALLTPPQKSTGVAEATRTVSMRFTRRNEEVAAELMARMGPHCDENTLTVDDG